MDSHGELDCAVAKVSTSEVSFVLSNLKKSAAAMLQDKERSRHSESVWRERLTAKEQRVAELETMVHAEQQKYATMASTMQEHKAQEAYLSQRVRTLTMLGSELQDRVNKLQGSVKAGEELQTLTIEKCNAEEHRRASMLDNATQLKECVNVLKTALDTAKAEICDKDDIVSTLESKLTSLRAELTGNSQKLVMSENECSSLQEQLLAKADALNRSNEQLRITAHELDAANQEKLQLEEQVANSHSMLTQLQDEHRLVLASKANIEQDKITLGEEKTILEQQVAAITSEHLCHVVYLEGELATLEQEKHQQSVATAAENLKVMREHTLEIEELHHTTKELQAQLTAERDKLKSVFVKNQELLKEVQKIPKMEVRHENAIEALGEENQQLSAELSLTKGCVVELEVERAVAKAADNAAIDFMDEANRALESKSQVLMFELRSAQQAKLVAASDQDNLRKEHHQQIIEWKDKLEALRARQAECIAVQREHLEAQMQGSLRILEEQAANHVKSIQQQFATAQNHATAMGEECKGLKQRVNSLEAEIKSIGDTKQNAQMQWDAKESQLCSAIQEERLAHEAIVRQLHEKHDVACATHKDALSKAEQDLQAMIATRQSHLQMHQAQVAELNALQASLQGELEASRIQLADMTANAKFKDVQIKSLESEVQKKSDLLKSISDKIGTPDVDPVTVPVTAPKASDLENKEPTPSKVPHRKRRRDKADPQTTDATMTTKRTSKKFGMPPKPHGAVQTSKMSRSKSEGRRGRMANMSSAIAGNEKRIGGLTSTEIFGGLMGSF